MTPAARVQLAIELLDAVIAAARDGGAAADTVASRLFKERRFAGSSDRRVVRALVWRAIRRFGEVPVNGRAALVALADDAPELAGLFNGDPHAPAPIAEDEPRAGGGAVPAWLLPRLDPRVSREPAELAALLERAPLDLRINPLRAAGIAMPEGEPLAAPLAGLRLPPDTPVVDHPAFLAGAVEVQDAGSQWIARACDPLPGQTVVDLCAGAGGKTLALAAAMRGEGRLIACDSDRRRLQALPPRATRAGAVGIELRLLDPGKEALMLADLSGLAHTVLVDAPCSGSGTWRRGPDARWRLTPARLARLVEAQARLLDLAAPLVAPGGALVYAVCALTRDEGERQIDAFLARHADWHAENPFAGHDIGRAAGWGRLLTPGHDGSDGFFVARLRAQ